MNIRPVDLGICHGYEYEGDPARTALVLPGALLGGMPVHAYAIEAAVSTGRRAVLVWDELLDRSQDDGAWVRARLDAAAAFAHDADELVVIAKSVSTLAAGDVADRGLRAVWLTPLLTFEPCVEMLRRRTAPALLVGGTADPAWDGDLARELSDDVLELDGADHGLAKIQHLTQVVDTIARFLSR